MSRRTPTLQSRRHLWALILAGGDGRRLRPLTTLSCGTMVPKQYCSLWGGPSLLQETLARAQRVVSREHVCAVVSAHHRRWWEPPLWLLPAHNTIVQPESRGTAVGVLLPLLHILKRDPAAQILLLPSDHHVVDEAVLADAIRSAIAFSAARCSAVVLLGITPDRVDPQLGYIVPGAEGEGGTFSVFEFEEKPPPARARELISRRALWNAFVLVASARGLLGLYERRCPNLVVALRQAVETDAASPVDGLAAADTYDRLPTLDFSRDILAGQEDQLRVLRVPACGWSDLGCPESVARVCGGPCQQQLSSGPWSVPTLALSAQHARASAREAAPAAGG